MCSVTTKIDNTFGKGANKSEVLARFIPILKTYYPTTYSEPKEELIANIDKNLIK